jgi:hypothetical protein
MADKTKFPWLLVATLGGAYLLTRKDSSSPSSGAPGAAGPGRPGKTDGPFSLPNIETGFKVGVPLLAAAGLSAPLAAAGVAVVVGGAIVGYEAEGPVGGVLGALNPAGAIGTLSARGAQELVKAAGGNSEAQGAATVSGFALGAIATVAEIGVAAALLPTVGIVLGLAELVGLIIGGNHDPAPPPRPQQEVDTLFALATNFAQTPAARSLVHYSDQDRVKAAAQLVAWANGPDPIPGVRLGGFSYPAQTNERRFWARERIPQLGLTSLLH